MANRYWLTVRNQVGLLHRAAIFQHLCLHLGLRCHISAQKPERQFDGFWQIRACQLRHALGCLLRLPFTQSSKGSNVILLE